MPANRNPAPLAAAAFLLAAVTLLLTGAIAGFFYAYSSSVMRGLDATAPGHAIAAMQGINATVRNAVFAPAFFGPPLAAMAAGAAFLALRRKPAGLAMFLAAAVYVLGAFLPTFAVNVPMNDALAGVSVPAAPEDAAALWRDFSARWTWWNSLRTGFSLLSLLLVGLALFLSGKDRVRA